LYVAGQVSYTNVKNEVMAYIAYSGWSLVDIVDEMNKDKPAAAKATVQDISNKLSSGSISYGLCLEIAGIIGYKIYWERLDQKDDN